MLRLIQSFVKETNYTVWQKLCSDLSVISRLVSYTEGGNDLFKEYARPLFTGVTERLGWDAEPNECKCLII